MAKAALRTKDSAAVRKKLIDEGYTGYLIRLSNDEAAGKTLGYGVVQNEIDNQKAAEALGCKKAFSFYYRNHRMDDCAVIELRSRLIFSPSIFCQISIGVSAE